MGESNSKLRSATTATNDRRDGDPAERQGARWFRNGRERDIVEVDRRAAAGDRADDRVKFNLHVIRAGGHRQVQRVERVTSWAVRDVLDARTVQNAVCGVEVNHLIEPHATGAD